MFIFIYTVKTKEVLESFPAEHRSVGTLQLTGLVFIRSKPCSAVPVYTLLLTNSVTVKKGRIDPTKLSVTSDLPISYPISYPSGSKGSRTLGTRLRSDNNNMRNGGSPINFSTFTFDQRFLLLSQVVHKNKSTFGRFKVSNKINWDKCRFFCRSLARGFLSKFARQFNSIRVESDVDSLSIHLHHNLSWHCIELFVKKRVSS